MTAIEMRSTDSIGQAFRERLALLCTADAPAGSFVSSVCSIGATSIVGGALRDWFFHRQPRDLDLVVEAEEDALNAVVAGLPHKRNRFGGFRVMAGHATIDVWTLSSTWAFRCGAIGKVSLETLPQTSFFNVDGIAFRLTDGKVIEHGFFDGMKRRQLAINYAENPFPDLCAIRAMVLARHYEMTLGDDVLAFIEERIAVGLTWSTSVRNQIAHYGAVRLSQADVDVVLPAPLARRIVPSSGAGARQRHTRRRTR